ncbi:two-component system response regulator [Pseudomonas sp. 1D4]|uniref:HD-GYP domain-containing protein n=1 Tax=Pseudomonadaceae TaxID=135621 RepID=UPI00084B1691|nr:MULTISPECIES: HD domain-containing phosphohydrolase [Pseudomonas]OEC37855.1 two-component system response regulator [Pseudomonas sp. 1D4]
MFSEIPTEARIVIVDDVAHNLKLLECSLKAFKLRNLVCFSDSAEALNWLQREPWDLLLLDLDMPQPDGFAILEALANRDRARTPVIILTALSDPENRRRGLELGANDYVTKPLDLPELLLRIRNCLHLAEATERLQHLNEHLEQEVRERTEQLNESYRAAIRGLSRAASYRDDETGEHILRIGHSAALLARSIGMPEHWCETIRLAAPMHDLGKIGIPDHILLKPGALTEDERRTMMQHPDIGYAILHDERGTLLIDMAADIAYGHHEKWDGSGYPRGLTGEDIPLAARIAAICDVYDALRSPRPYKQAWDLERAQAYILEQSGRHFEPRLVEAMRDCFEQIEAERQQERQDLSPP